MQRLLQLRVFGYLFLLGFFALPATAQPAELDTLWIEDWEGDWFFDWTVEAGTWEVGEPTSGPDSAYAGQNVAATVLVGNYAEGVNSRLIRTTSFVVPAASEYPRLRFFHWFSFSAADDGEVQISTDGGTTWEAISTSYSGSSSNTWSRPSLDLSTFAGQTVQVAFHFESINSGGGFSDVSTGWYIDEVAVETGIPVLSNPESFEMGLGDWAAERGTWEVGVPTAGPDTAYSPLNSAATVLDGNYAEGVDSRLISPPFIVPDAAEDPTLLFWHWYSFSAADDGEVQITTDGGATWESLAGPFVNTSSGVWSPVSRSISSYAGQTVQIAFHFESINSGGGFSDVSTGWYVDEVTLFCGEDICTDTRVPVELTAFDAAMDGADVLLRWSTASETNNAGFAVERRAEREGGFEQIGFVEGAGTTSEAQTYRFTDSVLLFGAERLTYRLKQIDLDGAFEYSPEVDVLVGVPKAFALHGNIPNPFGERTRLRYELPQSGDVRLTVYNVLGQRVATVVEEHQEAGRKEVVFDARGLASGVYVLRLEALGRMQTQKVTVVR